MSWNKKAKYKMIPYLTGVPLPKIKQGRLNSGKENQVEPDILGRVLSGVQSGHL